MVINFTTCSVMCPSYVRRYLKTFKTSNTVCILSILKIGLQDLRSNRPEIILKTAIQKISETSQKKDPHHSLILVKLKSFSLNSNCGCFPENCPELSEFHRASMKKFSLTFHLTKHYTATSFFVQ